MCNHMEILVSLQPHQIKPDSVKCTCSTLCWCNELSFRHPIAQDQDECMSPREILETYNSDLSKKDKVYLKKLSSREFIPN